MISMSNKRNNIPNLKKDASNSFLFWVRNEWNPHSNDESFSASGRWVPNKMLTPSNIKANNGININKKITEPNIMIILLLLYA